MKELEELYNRENSLATRGELGDIDSSPQHHQRIVELRQKFARERSELAKATKDVFFKVKPEEASSLLTFKIQLLDSAEWSKVRIFKAICASIWSHRHYTICLKQL